MTSGYDKFNLFIQAKRDKYAREFKLGNPEPEPPIDVLPTLGLQAGAPGFAAIRVVVGGPDHRRRNPCWYHEAALYVHPDRVLAKLYRSVRSASSASPATGDLVLPSLRGTIERWKKLSNRMMQEVNGLIASGDDDDQHGEEGHLQESAEDLPVLRKVLEMATEGHDLEMRMDFARRHRHWHSVKLQYVSARVDNAVAINDRKSQATPLPETEMRIDETIDSFIDRIALCIGYEQDDGEHRTVD